MVVALTLGSEITASVSFSFTSVCEPRVGGCMLGVCCVCVVGRNSMKR